MSIINGKLPVNMFYQTNAFVKKEESQEDIFDDSSSTENESRTSEPVNSDITGNQLDNDFLLTYRGVEINHIDTAIEKNIVSNTAPKPLCLSSGVSEPKEPENSSEEINSPYLVDNSIIHKRHSLYSTYTKNKPFINVYNTMEKGLAEAKNLTKAMLNSLASEILNNKKNELKGFCDTELLQELLNEAVTITNEEFSKDPKVVNNSSYTASQGDDCLVFAKTNNSSKVRLSFNVRNFVDKFLENFNSICQENAKVTQQIQKQIIDKIDNTFNKNSERYSKAFSSEEEFSVVFESAKNTAMEQIIKEGVSKQEDIQFIFDRSLSTTINDFLWAQYEAETDAPEGSMVLSTSTMSSNAVTKSSKGKSPQVTANKTVMTKDGSKITVNYEGVYKNGLLITNPETKNINCSITITDPNGNKTTLPFDITLDLVPGQNKKLIEALKHDTDYYYSGDPTLFLNSHPEYRECDLFTPDVWVAKLAENVANSFCGLSSDALNVLIKENTIISVSDKENSVNPNSLAEYNFQQNIMTLYTGIDRANGSYDGTAFKPYVITHEIGHAQDYIGEENQSSNLFSNLEEWEKFKELIPSDFQNAYAFENISEFFAEYYAYKNCTDRSDLSGTTAKKSIAAFNYLEGLLRSNPNCELSNIYKHVKTNADKIIKSEAIEKNGEGIPSGKKFTKEELLQKIKDDWTNDKIGLKDIGDECEDLAATFGLNMDTKDFLAEYYKHFYLKEPSDLIKKIENATGMSKYGEPIKDLWNKIEKSSQYGNGLKDACDKFDKKIQDAQKTDSYAPGGNKETNAKEGFTNNIVTGLNVNNIKNNQNNPVIEGSNINIPNGLDEKVKNALNNLGKYYADQAKEEALEKYGKNANVEINVNVTVDDKGNVKVRVDASVLGYIDGNNGKGGPKGDITGGSGNSKPDRQKIPGLDKDGKIPVNKVPPQNVNDSDFGIFKGVGLDITDYMNNKGQIDINKFIADWKANDGDVFDFNTAGAVGRLLGIINTALASKNWNRFYSDVEKLAKSLGAANTYFDSMFYKQSEEFIDNFGGMSLEDKKRFTSLAFRNFTKAMTTIEPFTYSTPNKNLPKINSQNVTPGGDAKPNNKNNIDSGFGKSDGPKDLDEKIPYDTGRNNQSGKDPVKYESNSVKPKKESSKPNVPKNNTTNGNSININNKPTTGNTGGIKNSSSRKYGYGF